MTNELAIKTESALIMGDLAKLTPDERLSYYKNVCESVGLNPLTKPFDYLSLNGKTVLYAKRDATDQLRKIHGVSVRITGRETIGDVHVVTASATDKTGRCDESTGAVAIGNAKGDNLANALMKAETKAKRRVTLSICGLGLLDETETETIPGAKRLEELPAPHVEPVKHTVTPPKPVNPQGGKPVTLATVIEAWKGKNFENGTEFGAWIEAVRSRIGNVADVPDDHAELVELVRTDAGMGEEATWDDLKGEQIILGKNAVMNWLNSLKPKAGAV